MSTSVVFAAVCTCRTLLTSLYTLGRPDTHACQQDQESGVFTPTSSTAGDR